MARAAEAQDTAVNDDESLLGRAWLDGDPIYVGASSYRCQCIYSHPMLDATTISFIVHGGRRVTMI